MQAPSVSVSVVLPICNESGNLRGLIKSLVPVLDGLQTSYEILACDDGSTDDSLKVLRELSQGNEALRVLSFRRNFGQTAALMAGIDHARGEVVVLMDADRQNDPADIPRLLAQLDEGYDVVSGWRKNRQDAYWTKVFPSRIANGIISWVTGVRLRDYGCTLKAYRRDVLEQVSLYGEMHRFIPIFAHWIGAKVGEVEVNHLPRTVGKSKYTLAKTFKVLLDLPVLLLMGSYLTRPIHLFGGVGLVNGLLGILCVLLVVVDISIDPDAKAHRSPFLLLSVFFFLVGVQMVMIGLLAELLTRVYHESQQKKTYSIRETINLSVDSDR